MHRNNKGFEHFEEWQEQIINQEIIEQKNLNKKIAEETEWLHKGVTARRKRNMGALRRLQQCVWNAKNKSNKRAPSTWKLKKGISVQNDCRGQTHT